MKLSTSTKVRLAAGLFLFLMSEACLLGAAEGVQKSSWISFGTIPNVILTLGFVLL